MRVRITWDFDLEERRAVRAHVGLPGVATYEECRGWLISALAIEMETAMGELNHQEAMDASDTEH